MQPFTSKRSNVGINVSVRDAATKRWSNKHFQQFLSWSERTSRECFPGLLSIQFASWRLVGFEAYVFVPSKIEKKT